MEEAVQLMRTINRMLLQHPHPSDPIHDHVKMMGQFLQEVTGSLRCHYPGCHEKATHIIYDNEGLRILCYLATCSVHAKKAVLGPDSHMEEI